MRNFRVCTVHLIFRVIKSRRLGWTSHVARMEEGRNALKVLVGRTILELIFKKWVSILGIGLIRLRIGILGEPL